MRRSMLCAGMLSLSRATSTCDAEDEHSLLQGGLKREPLVAQQQGPNPAELLQSVQNMVRHMAGSEQVQAPEEMTAAIVTIRETLGLVRPLLTAQHNSDEDAIQLQLGEIQACLSHSDHGSDATGDLAAQLAVMSECITAQDDAAEEQEIACDAWTSHSNRMRQFLPISAPSPSATPDSFFATAATLKDWMDDEWDDIASKHTACIDATTFSIHESTRCAPVIADYDNTFCQHSLSCTLLNTCHRHEVEVYETLISDTTASMTSRQDQFRMILQVECIVGLMETALATNSTISGESLDSQCGADVDVSALTITFPEPEAVSDCPPAHDSDPQCPEVDLPLAWEGGEAEEPQVTQGEFVIEFCRGPRSGQQFTITFPTAAEERVSNLVGHHGQEFEEVLCYGGQRAPDTLTQSFAFVGFTTATKTYVDYVEYVWAASSHCTHLWGSGLNFDVGVCGGEVSHYWRQGRHTHNHGSIWDIPDVMSSQGGQGWDIFSTVADGETYKVVSTPRVQCDGCPRQCETCSR